VHFEIIFSHLYYWSILTLAFRPRKIMRNVSNDVVDEINCVSKSDGVGAIQKLIWIRSRGHDRLNYS